MPYSDAEWKQRLDDLAARCEAEDVAREEAERSDPALALERQRQERHRVLDAVAAELRGIGVPEVTVEPFAVGTVLETAAITRARLWWRTRSWILVIHGDPGVGKDVAMAYNRARQAKKRAESRTAAPRTEKCWFSAYDLMQLAGYGQAEERERVETMPELYIEDLGTESPKLDLLFNILNKRSQNRLRTLATTNLNLKDFGAYAGARICDRIDAWGAFSGVEGPNLRRIGFNGEHGLSPVGTTEPTRHHSEPEEREGRIIARPSNYRIRYRTLSLRAQSRRRQLSLQFNIA